MIKNSKVPVAILGGIQVNTAPGLGDEFVVKTFQVFNSEGDGKFILRGDLKGTLHGLISQ